MANANASHGEHPGSPDTIKGAYVDQLRNERRRCAMSTVGA